MSQQIEAKSKENTEHSNSNTQSNTQKPKLNKNNSRKKYSLQ